LSYLGCSITHPHHRRINELFAAAGSDLDGIVLGYEIWAMHTPNAFLDISAHLERKLEVIALYESQLRTVDYLSYAKGLARVRAFHLPVSPTRGGAVEA
jgi:LmbE family N-acetylglucosaminyl deacetylase